MQLFFCLILFFAIELSLSIIEFRITTNAMQVEYFFTSSGVSIEIELNSRVPKMRFVSKIKTNISESENESDKDSDLPGASKLRLLVNFSPASSFWTMLRILSRIAPFDIWFISSPLIELIRNCSLPKVSFLTSCSSCASSSISIISRKKLRSHIEICHVLRLGYTRWNLRTSRHMTVLEPSSGQDRGNSRNRTMVHSPDNMKKLWSSWTECSTLFRI